MTLILVTYWADPWSSELDQMITKAVGKKTSASGVRLDTMVRDMTWTFEDREAALEALDRLNSLSRFQPELQLRASAQVPQKDSEDTDCVVWGPMGEWPLDENGPWPRKQ